MTGADHILSLHREIRRNHQARYYHRLHGVLLVLRGMSCQQAGRLIGDSARALQYWVKRFETAGLEGLYEKERPGRPRRLGPEHLEELKLVLQRQPTDFGLESDFWDAKSLSAYLRQNCAIVLGLRQCQRLLRQFGCNSPRARSKTFLRPAIINDETICESNSSRHN
ncbi:MAG: hypothetical protein B9S32_07690 [Verrucomicrobia bacterium Tous-C9LFEB]|nr:MAG: hypothetical protein B9S32_07690 [Verrucomicrobia bacterium Tous-C9LFEB]